MTLAQNLDAFALSFPSGGIACADMIGTSRGLCLAPYEGSRASLHLRALPLHGPCSRATYPTLPSLHPSFSSMGWAATPAVPTFLSSFPGCVAFFSSLHLKLSCFSVCHSPPPHPTISPLTTCSKPLHFQHCLPTAPLP